MNLKELETRVEELESELYGESAYDNLSGLYARAADLFAEVLDCFELAYSCPGEPEAEGTQRDGSHVRIPLTSANAGNNGGLRTSEEEELEATGEFELPSDLYWARLRVAQAKDILGNGWQYGLVYDGGE